MPLSKAQLDDLVLPVLNETFARFVNEGRHMSESRLVHTGSIPTATVASNHGWRYATDGRWSVIGMNKVLKPGNAATYLVKLVQQGDGNVIRVYVTPTCDTDGLIAALHSLQFPG